MASKEQLIAAFDKADKLFKETGEERHRENAKAFAQAIQNFQEPSEAPGSPTESREARLERERAEVADGITLRPFGIDTGIEMPQAATEFLAGAGRRLAQIGTLGTHEGDDKANELLDDSGYATAGGIVTDMAAMAPLGVPNSLAKAAVTGAAYAGATTPGDLKERAANAAAGGVGGAAGYGLTKAASAAANPKLDPKALALEEQGIRVTPGRLVGGAGTRLEDAATSLPLTGDAIRNRQIETLADYNKSVLNDVVESIGGTVDDVGREGIEKAAKAVSSKYDEVLDSLGGVRLDDEFTTLGSQLKQMVKTLGDADQKRFQKAYDGLMRHFDNENGLALGRTYKTAESELRKAYKRAYDRGQKDLGDALRTLFKNTRDMARRQHPEVIEQLDAVDVAYSKLSTVQAAANYKGARDGLFTPDHLLSAIRKKTPDALYAQGRGFDQKATEAAKEVLMQSVPDSGTAGRSILAAASTGFVHPAVPVGLAAGGAANSRAGQDVMRAALLSRPDASRRVGEVLDILSPYIARAGTGAGINQP